MQGPENDVAVSLGCCFQGHVLSTNKIIVLVFKILKHFNKLEGNNIKTNYTTFIHFIHSFEYSLLIYLGVISLLDTGDQI